MSSYEIVYREECVGTFYVDDADSVDAAIAEFNRQCANGEVDFSDMELVDSSITAVRMLSPYDLDGVKSYETVVL